MGAISVLGNAKSNRHRKTYLVELGGATRQYMFLLGEILLVRASKKSAEAIVATTPAERPEQRRAKESRKNHNPNLIPRSAQRVETSRRHNDDDYRNGEASRSGGS